jgi:putative transposase
LTIAERIKGLRYTVGASCQVICILSFPQRINNPDVVLGRFKEFTSKKLQATILDYPQESRKEWMIWMFERAAAKSSNVQKRQLWQHHNKPIESYGVMR